MEDNLTESQHAISDNPGYGYHGTVDVAIHKSKKTTKNEKSSGKSDEQAERAKHYRKMHQLVRSTTGADAKVAKHYLDSKHGRHLADVHNDNVQRRLAVSHVHNYIKKDFAKFQKHYKPELFEGVTGDIELVIKETAAEMVKRIVKEEAKTHTADKKTITARDSSGKVILKQVRRKQDVVHPGGTSQNDTAVR